MGPMKAAVLAVDDDPDILEFVSRILEKEGCSILTAENGREGMAMLARDPLPDIIISDVDMPKMNGWKFVRNLRSNSRTSFIPVIFLTNNASSRDRLRGFSMGADDFLSKEHLAAELTFRVRHTLQRRKPQERIRRRMTERVSSMKGKLDSFPLSTLCNLFSMEQKTGILQLKNGQETIRLWIQKGVLVDARSNQSNLSGADCFHRAMLWQKGSFMFQPGPFNRPASILETLPALLIESARRIDEESRS